jgi:hypothetical protein
VGPRAVFPMGVVIPMGQLAREQPETLSHRRPQWSSHDLAHQRITEGWFRIPPPRPSSVSCSPTPSSLGALMTGCIRNSYRTSPLMERSLIA